MLKRVVLFFLLLCAAHAGEFADRYSERLAQLDQMRPESVCGATEALRDLLPQASSAGDRTSMFRSFVGFNQRVAAKTSGDFTEALAAAGDKTFEILDQKHWNSGSASPYLREDPMVRQAIAPWLDCGFGIYHSEGDLYLGPDVATLGQFSPLLPDDLREWVGFLQTEGGFADTVQNDFGLTLSWQELGSRLHRWENFLRVHPSLAQEVRPEVSRLAYFFFFGLDNSPLQVVNSNQVQPEVLAAWRRFALDPGESRYTATVNKLLALLGADGGQMGPDTVQARYWIELEWIETRR